MNSMIDYSGLIAKDNSPKLVNHFTDTASFMYIIFAEFHSSIHY